MVHDTYYELEIESEGRRLRRTYTHRERMVEDLRDLERRGLVESAVARTVDLTALRGLGGVALVWTREQIEEALDEHGKD